MRVELHRSLCGVAREARQGQTYNEEAFGQLPPIRRPEWFEHNPNASLYDISKARRVLGYRPTSNWRKFSRREVP